MQKTVLITGATSGIGKATAIALSKLGYHVIMIIFLSTVPTVPGDSGDYYIKRKPANKSVRYYSREREELIWTYCMRLSGLVQY